MYQQIKIRHERVEDLRECFIGDGVLFEIVMYLREVGKNHTPTAGDKVKNKDGGV